MELAIGGGLFALIGAGGLIVTTLRSRVSRDPERPRYGWGQNPVGRDAAGVAFILGITMLVIALVVRLSAD